MSKKIQIKIDNPDRRKRFIQMAKKFFHQELSQNTLKVAIKECDIIEFAFKDNGFIHFKRRDIENK